MVVCVLNQQEPRLSRHDTFRQFRYLIIQERNSVIEPEREAGWRRPVEIGVDEPLRGEGDERAAPFVDQRADAAEVADRRRPHQHAPIGARLDPRVRVADAGERRAVEQLRHIDVDGNQKPWNSADFSAFAQRRR